MVINTHPFILLMDPEQDAMMTIASLMAVSARTAPKGKGVDTIVTRIIFGEEIITLADEMKRLGDTTGLTPFPRDSLNVRECSVCVLIGCKGTEDLGLNCGGCGYPSTAASRTPTPRPSATASTISASRR